MKEFDAVVLGGGLAGSCAAYNLARRGAHVALLEAGSFPRHKVCGEFLSPESRQIFGRLGIEERLNAAGAHEVFAARLFVPDGRFLEVPLAKPALAISRYALDQILWDNACRAGVHGFENTRVRAMTRNKALEIQTSQGAFKASGVIEARGRIASHAETQVGKPQKNKKVSPPKSRFFGLKTHWRGAHLEPGVTELHIFQGGYCGVGRIEGELSNICLLACYETWQISGAKSPEELFQWILRQCPALAKRVLQGTIAMPWMATGNVAFTSPLPLKGGAFRAGDAAGFIHPLTGDGMTMALRGGEIAAVTLAAQLRGGAGAADSAAIYEAAWRRELQPRLGWARYIAPLFLNPLSARSILPIARHFPALAQFLLNKTRG